MGGIGPQFDLSGKVALVTGSSRGIGRSIALALAEAGADCAIHDESGSAAATAVAGEVRALGRWAEVFGADLEQADSAEKLVSAVEARMGAPDIVVLSASSERRRAWDQPSEEDFNREVAVNLRSTVALVARVRPAMAARRWGRILFIGSIQTLKPNPRLAVYASLKAAGVNLVRMLSRELAPEGITVNVLSPGAIATDRNAAALSDPTHRAWILSQIPVGRIGRPEDCAAAALLLCAPGAGYINGQELFVDGGWHAT